MHRGPAGPLHREWMRLFLAGILVLLCGSTLSAHGALGQSVLSGRRMTKRAQEILRITPDSHDTLAKLFGRIELTHRVQAPDGQLTVLYFNSSKYPKWTAMTGTVKGCPDLLFFELRIRIYTRSTRLEYGDSEAWIPLNGKRVLVWAPFYNTASILDLAVTRTLDQHANLNELLVDFDFDSPQSADAISPLRALPRKDGTDEWDLLFLGKRLSMGRTPYYWWR